MALVAYSDESDISDDDDALVPSSSNIPESSASTKKKANTFSEVKLLSPPEASSAETSISNSLPVNQFCVSDPQGSVTSLGIGSIVDEDDFGEFVVPGPNNIISPNRKLLSALTAVTKSESYARKALGTVLDVGEDELTDVPTKETWQVAQQVLEMKGTSKGSNSTKRCASKGSSINCSTKPTFGKAQQVALASSALGGLLQKKRVPGSKVQLMLPSMAEFMEEEEELDESPVIKKKLAPSNAGTGLFSLLPKPKNFTVSKEANRSLVPHILSKPPPKKSSKKIINEAANKKPANAAKASTLNIIGSYDDSDDEEMGTEAPSSLDFFSLDGKASHVPLPTPDEVDDSLIINEVLEPCKSSAGKVVAQNVHAYHRVKANNSTFSNIFASYDDDRPQNNVEGENSSINSADSNTPEDFISTESSAGDLNMPFSVSHIDSEAWRRLTGKKHKSEDVNIIDVNTGDVLLSQDEWMNHAASQEKPSHSHSKKRGDLPSQQQKRKHQITYLAHQAKEREIELKNDWSAGRLKKQQTRAKYGF